VYTVGTDELLRPIAHECLAHPSGLALSPGDTALYVCETLANRLLRFVQKPQGVFHMSVFHQFSGKLGPVAVACDHQRGGLLYVARFDFDHCAEEGCVTVLSPEGAHIRDIAIGGAEVSGLAISPNGDFLLVSDSANSTLTRVSLAA
jgi:sugar lactone lactonase YvrE